jgi:hypothetical protein
LVLWTARTRFRLEDITHLNHKELFVSDDTNLVARVEKDSIPWREPLTIEECAICARIDDPILTLGILRCA